MKMAPTSRAGKIRFACLIILLLIPVTYAYLLPLLHYALYTPEEGDIIFQSLPDASDLVKTIEGVSSSPFSHCGVVVYSEKGWQVNEAIDQVHSTPLLEFILRGRGGHFAVYRVKPEHRSKITSFLAALEKYQGRPYDFKYQLDDEYIYCSELVFKAYKDATKEDLGQLMRLGDLEWRPFEATIREYEGGPPPLDRLMITPKHLALADQLMLVYSFGY